MLQKFVSVSMISYEEKPKDRELLDSGHVKKRNTVIDRKLKISWAIIYLSWGEHQKNFSVEQKPIPLEEAFLDLIGV